MQNNSFPAEAVPNLPGSTEAIGIIFLLKEEKKPLPMVRFEPSAPQHIVGYAKTMPQHPHLAC